MDWLEVMVERLEAWLAIVWGRLLFWAVTAAGLAIMLAPLPTVIAVLGAAHADSEP